MSKMLKQLNKNRAQLFVFDPADNLLTVTKDYLKAPFKETVTKPESLKITMPADDPAAEHFTGGNQVAFRDLKGNFRLFLIREMDDQDGEATDKEVECFPAMSELVDVIVREKRPQDKTAEEVLEMILEESRWQVGNVVDLGKNSTSFYFKEATKCLDTLISIWGGELQDRIEIKDNKIAGRYIDIVNRKGENNGKRFEMGKDIKNINRTMLYYPKTALYGKGSSLEQESEEGKTSYSRKITFRDVVWKKSEGDPVDKPKGQEWVGDEDARKKHGIPNSKTGKIDHRFGMFEDGEEEDPETLLKKTWEAVGDEKDPEFEYSMEIMTFYNVSDYEHEQVFLGDTGIARDMTIKPKIIVEARVTELEYDLGDPSDGQVVIGNIIDLSDRDRDIDWVIDKVKDNAGKWDDGGGPITDEKFPDVKPDVPENFEADGLFQTIMLSWDFESTYAIAKYELFGSQTKGFVPDKTNRLFAGKTGGYSFLAETNEKWYFRLRAVNTHGTASDFTDEVSASTVELRFDDLKDIVPDFIEHSIYEGDEPPDPKSYKYWVNTSKEPNMLYRWDKDEEKWVPLSAVKPEDIGAVDIKDYEDKINDILKDIEEKAGLEYVDGQLKEVNEVVEGNMTDIQKNSKEIRSKASQNEVNEIDGEVKKNTSEIKQQAKLIESKVDSTEYKKDKDGIIEELESQGTRITQTEKDITSKVDAKTYEADKNSLEKSIESNSSEIKQNAKAITSKVDSETYKADKKGITADIERNKSEIKQTAEKVSSKVDAKYVDGQIGKIEIGDTNILTHTDFSKESNIDDWYSWLNSITEIKQREVDGEYYLYFNINSDVAEGSYPRIRTPYRYRLLNGKTYTITWFAFSSDYISSDPYAGLYVNGAIKNNFKDAEKVPYKKVTYNDLTKTVYKYTCTFEYNGQDDDDCAFYIGAESQNGKAAYYLFNKPMLVRGNKAGNWKPAKSDTDSAIDSVREYASNIEQTAKGIKADVTALEKDVKSQGVKISDNASQISQNAKEIKSKVTSKTYDADMKDLNAKVSTAQSEIKQNADSITSKVSKNGVRSAIMQSPESIKLSAEVVDIKGDLRVQSGNIYVKDGVITNKLIAGNAAIDFAKIAKVKITNAMISSVSAAKVNTGILNAAKVTVQVKNGTQAITIDDKGFKSVDSKGNVRIHIGVRAIAGKGEYDPATILFYGGTGSKSAGVGMNVNNTFIIGSSATKVGMELRTHYSMNTIYYAKEHRFVSKGQKTNGFQSKYLRFLGRTSGSDENPVLEPSTSGWGYLGTSPRRLWYVYTNNLRSYVKIITDKLTANNIVNNSSRDIKKDIKNVSTDDIQAIFDKITLKRYKYKTKEELAAEKEPSNNTDDELDDNDEMIGENAENQRVRIGGIAEEMPAEVLNTDKKSVDLYDYSSVIAGSLKHQTKRIDLHDNEIVKLQNKVSDLENEISELKGA